MIEGSVFLVIGLLAGFLAAQAAAPSLSDQVLATQEEGRTVAAQLRVLALHDEAAAASVKPGDSSQEFALERATSGLKTALASAPWIPAPTRSKLLAGLANLDKTKAEPGFGTRADSVAGEIQQAFGISKDEQATHP
jgi:hypothetical protein